MSLSTPPRLLLPSDPGQPGGNLSPSPSSRIGLSKTYWVIIFAITDKTLNLKIQRFKTFLKCEYEISTFVYYSTYSYTLTWLKFSIKLQYAILFNLVIFCIIFEYLVIQYIKHKFISIRKLNRFLLKQLILLSFNCFSTNFSVFAFGRFFINSLLANGSIFQFCECK